MTNPELIALVVAALRCVVRLMDALSERIVLRGQIELIHATSARHSAIELIETPGHGGARRTLIHHGIDRCDHQEPS